MAMCGDIFLLGTAAGRGGDATGNWQVEARDAAEHLSTQATPFSKDLAT